MMIEVRKTDAGVSILGAQRVIKFLGRGLRPSAEAGISAVVLPAMKLGEPVEMVGSLTPRLANNLPIIQKTMAGWNSQLKPVSIRAATQDLTARRGTAQFFTGGVDSLFTFFARRDEIDALIFVHGFDLRLEDVALRGEVSRNLQQFAAEAGKVLVEVSSDVREFSNRYLAWTWYHGSALATIAHLLADRFDHVLIPSSFADGELFPWGSHPSVDPLWSGAVEIEHHGSEAARLQKIEALRDEALAQRYLRVCYRNYDGAYNCGRCEKCIRTMISLRVLGALHKFERFPSEVDLNAARRLPVGSKAARTFAEQNLRAVRRRGDDRALEKTLAAQLRWGYLRHGRRKAERALKKIVYKTDEAFFGSAIRRAFRR